MKTKPIVEYYGYINASGYSNAAKNYIMALISEGYDVVVTPIGTSFIDKRSELDLQMAEIIEKRKERTVVPDIRIIHAVPPVGLDVVSMNVGIPNVWLYAWEGINLPQEFVSCLKKADHCVTFSRLQVDVYKRCLGKENISYLPHIVSNRMKFDPDDVKPKKRRKGYMFLSVFEWTERKDPITLLKAYLHEFNSDDPVSLIMKLISVPPNDVRKQIEAVLKNMRLRKNPPKILPITTYLSDGDMGNLYREADCYVSSSRGEGFGVPLVESLFYGTPVIYPEKYTDDFPFNKDNSASVKAYDTFMYASKYDVNRGDNIWGQVSDVDLAAKMRWMFENSRDKLPNPVLPGPEFMEEYNKIGSTLSSIVEKALAENSKIKVKSYGSKNDENRTGEVSGSKGGCTPKGGARVSGNIELG